MGRYDDIIDLPHHTSPRHPRMSIQDRAAQFSPFAALTGHDAAIRETARLTDRKIDLDEDVKTQLDAQLRFLAGQADTHPEVTVVYFKPDVRKDGGAYETVTGTVKRIDDYERIIVFTDGARIPFDDILELHSEVIPQENE